MSITLLHPRAATIPAGTLSSAPFEQGMSFPPGLIESVTWRFPGGCNGQVGIKLASSHVPIFPASTTEWIVHSDAISGYDVQDFPDSGDFSLLGYNLGSFPHTIQIEWRMRRREPEDPIPGYLVADLVDTMRGGY